MNHKRGFTLVEIMVVIAIIALVTVISMPTIRAMQTANAHSQAVNMINAALQGARSYAIMNSVNTAARFQPNGKIFLVYRYPGLTVENWSGSQQISIGPIYLPVLNHEPLRIPNGYGVADARTEANRRPFFEPFYVCYKPDGTLAVGEPIRVGLVDDTGTPQPVNPYHMAGTQTRYAWNPPFPGSYAPKTFWQFVEDPAKVDDPSYRSWARFYNVARDKNEVEAVVNETLDGKDNDYGPDHYAGAVLTTYKPPGYYVTLPVVNLLPQATTQIAVFRTPENWDQLPLFSGSDPNKLTKQTFVDDCYKGILAEDNNGNQTRDGSFDRVFINPYTGRIIKPAE